MWEIYWHWRDQWFTIPEWQEIKASSVFLLFFCFISDAVNCSNLWLGCCILRIFCQSGQLSIKCYLISIEGRNNFIILSDESVGRRWNCFHESCFCSLTMSQVTIVLPSTSWIEETKSNVIVRSNKVTMRCIIVEEKASERATCVISLVKVAARKLFHPFHRTICQAFIWFGDVFSSSIRKHYELKCSTFCAIIEVMLFFLTQSSSQPSMYTRLSSQILLYSSLELVFDDVIDSWL